MLICMLAMFSSGSFDLTFSVGRPLQSESTFHHVDPTDANKVDAFTAARWQRGRRGSHVGRTALNALPDLPDLNLAAWFASQLAAMPERVADYGPFGALYFILVGGIAESLTFPVTPVMLTAGYIFGLPGVGVMLLSSALAASIHFLLSRSILRPYVQDLIEGNDKARCVNRAVEREGFKLMFLMRLEPMLPSSITNFTFGLSSVSYSDFALATLLGNIPYSFVFVSSASVLQNAVLPWYAYAIGAVLYIGLLWLITVTAGKAIEEAIQEDAVAPQISDRPLQQAFEG